MKTKTKKSSLSLWLLLLPGLIYLIINNYLPMAGLIIAFKKLDFSVGILRSPWAGLSNFKLLFASPDAFTITRNTILYNLVFIVVDNLLGVTIAVLLNNVVSKKLHTLYQSVLLLPYLISMVIVAYLVYAFLSPTTGMINAIITNHGGKMVNWYMDARKWPVILTIVHIWKSVGFNCIYYLATLVGISPEYYEAASLDGATKWQQFTKITVPLLKPTIITLVVLSVGRMFYSDFGLFFQIPMNSGMLYRTTRTIDTYVYNALMNSGSLGMSAAAGLFQSVVGFVCIVAVNLIIRRYDKDQALF